jgi:hypothetical protein
MDLNTTLARTPSPIVQKMSVCSSLEEKQEICTMCPGMLNSPHTGNNVQRVRVLDSQLLVRTDGISATEGQ